MKNAYKIAGFGLAAGAAVMIAVTAPAVARGQMDGFGGAKAMGPGARGVFSVQFSDLDTDGDGLITEAELAARAQGLADERVAGVDTDGDGIVTAEELEAQIIARMDERGARRMAPQNDDRQAQRQMDPAEMAKVMVERMISARDTDGDGALSGEELSPAAELAVLIDRFDTDDDNAWNAEEFAQVTQGKGGFGNRGHGKGDRGGKRR